MSYYAKKLREFIGPAPILPPSSVVHPGEDVCGFYPSTRLQNDLCFLPRPFSKLQPASVNYEAETPFQPDFDNSALRKYTHFQKIMKKATSNQYNQTSYKAAFDVPCLNAGN
ncbi:Uncharacterized protein C1orf100, partial [Tyto alba]